MKKILLVLALAFSVSCFSQESETSYDETTPLYDIASVSLEYIKSVSTTTRYTFTYGLQDGLSNGVEWVFYNYDGLNYINLDSALGIIATPSIELSANIQTKKPIDIKIVETNIGIGSYVSVRPNQREGGENFWEDYMDCGIKLNLDIHSILGIEVSEMIGKVLFFLPNGDK